MAGTATTPVPDMTGRTVVVTGANSGIGLETAKALVRAGAHTVITARDPAKGAAALEEVARAAEGSSTPGGTAELVIFDLADLASVRRGAEEILRRCPELHVLVNNAGVVLSQRQVTVDGYEATFAVNHLGPFLLTRLLLDRLTASAPARVVTVSSTAHNPIRQGLDFDDLQSTGKYAGMRVYGAAKLANILFTTELARRTAGTGVTANCLHPGVVATGYARDGDTSGLLAVGIKLIKPFILSPAQGARTSIFLATSPEVATVTGKYFVKSKERQPSKAAQDAEAARRLWEVSEQLVGWPTGV